MMAARRSLVRGEGRWIVGGVTALAGVAVLIAGLLPPHVMATGQIDPRVWALPAAGGAALVIAAMRWTTGRWRTVALIPAVLAMTLPPMILCAVASSGQTGRLAIWLHPDPESMAQQGARPRLGILSGPPLFHPAPGGAMAGFAMAPLWRMLDRLFACVPLAALDDEALAKLQAVLLVQPRALAPEELVALDRWVRRGGRAVILTDPDLLWADERPLGHALRAPPVGLLSPLLHHWGLILAPAPLRQEGDPVRRRFLDDGRIIQTAGASHFLPTAGGACTLSSGGLVAHCALGRGRAILVADADFANDALWTGEPEMPGRMGAWTSDAVPVLEDWLIPGLGERAAGRRVWLRQAEGLPKALRPALLMLAFLVGLTILTMGMGRTKREL